MPVSAGSQGGQHGPNPGYDMRATGPVQILNPNTPQYGYARLAPGSQFEQGSEIVVPMRSRRGILAAVIGTVVVLTVGFYLTSSSGSSSSAGEEPEASQEGAIEGVSTRVQTETPPPIAKAETVEEQAAADKQAAAEKKAGGR